MAWCLQIVPPDASSSSSNKSAAASSSSSLRSSPRIKVTVFWSWDLRGAWMGMPAGGLGMHLPELIKGLLSHARDSSDKIPFLQNYGNCVELLSNSFDTTRDTLACEYAVIVEDTVAREAEDRAHKNLDTLNLLRSRRKLEAAVEFYLPAMEGWDVRVEIRGQTASKEKADPSGPADAPSSPWRATAERSPGSQYTVLAIRHDQLQDSEELVRIKVRIQRVVASNDLRVNDDLVEVTQVEPRTPASLAQPLLEDTASISGISVATASTGSAASVTTTQAGNAANASRSGTPNPGFANQINSQIRRNYIYFTSLLQEPEAKWKPISDMKGVTVTQLDSIDPTLVVYRAEATFVGVSVWDLFSTIGNPGARAYWDKTLDDATLLADINELSSLWQTKTKPSWPVSARDTIVIQTAYKAPTSVHVFSFSTDDRAQFPAIPQVETGTIRTQIDLRGWSIEALSPTTVHVTMLEQSDPKGWTSKSATPAAMVGAVAGVGEYAIKFGGPPVLTRMLGAKTKVSRYDHEKATFRVEYASDVSPDDDLNDAPHVECEIRCDVETWANSLDLVVDPPPISISCLRRHKLSQGGGGLWLTIEHAAASLEDDSARITIRRGNAREKGAVHVNGASIKVDVDELNDEQVQQLSRQKRTKPQRVPLDLIRPARKATEEPATPGKADAADSSASAAGNETTKDQQSKSSRASSINEMEGKEKVGSALVVPASADETAKVRESTKSESRDSSVSPSPSLPFSDETPRQPMTCALDVLFLLRRIHAERSPDPAGTPAGWALVTERNGLYVRRKLMESISSTVMVQRGDKVVQGLSAEDLLDLVSNPQSRKQWDDKIDSTTLLESYGDGSFTSFITTKASFPFRGRAFHLASLTARGMPPSSLGATSPGESTLSSSASSWSGPAVYFHASASFAQQKPRFGMDRINPNNLPLGKILIDGWILETLDPYSSTSFQIPSTRCTHVVAIDYAGSLPIAVNTMWNASLPRSILLIEEYLKARGSIPSVKTPPPCLQVLGDGRDEDQGLIWSINGPDRKNLHISTSFDPSTRRYVAVSMHRATPRADAGQVPGLLPAANIVTNGKGRTARVSDASLTKSVADKLAQAINAAPGTPMLGSAAPPVNSSGEQSSGLSRATSMHSIASTTANSSASTIRRRPSSLHADSRNATDLILMEVEIELRHYHQGYDVQVYSEFVPVDAAGAFSQASTSQALERPKTPTGNGAERAPSEQLIGISESGKALGSTEAILSLKMAPEKSKDLPVQLRVYDLPPSAVLAATLDPSARPRKHLVRVIVPTTAFLDPVDDPLTGSKAPEIPAWYTSLLERGAVLRMVVKPLKGEGAETDGGATAPKDSAGGVTAFTPPTGKVNVRSGEAKLDVVHVNQTSAMLQKEQIGIEPMTQLKRVAPPRAKSGRKSGGETMANRDDLRLPAALRRPVATRKDLLVASETSSTGKDSSKTGPSATGAGSAGKTANGSGSSVTGDASATAKQAGDPGPSSTSGSANGSAAGSAPPSRAATPSAPASTGAGIMSMFGSYPLSRLGTGSAQASSLTSVSSVTARGSSVASSSSAKTNAEALAAKDGGKHGGKGAGQKGDKAGTVADGDDTGAGGDSKGDAGTSTGEAVAEAAANAGNTVAQLAKESASAISKLFSSETHFRFSTLLLVAVAAYLLGSLMRSTISPVDFVLVPTRQKPFHAAKDVAAGLTGQSARKDFLELVKSTSGKSSGLEDDGMVRQVQWTQLRRLVHVRLPGVGWDVVVGGVRRR
uniref:START domain-containing protein n=2 Tax=Kalmanozyma brasiliensis (strain GHG001) TaxID=1365824 RepID=V5EA12_KALBG